MKTTKIILMAILILAIGGILIAWQNFLTREQAEQIEHPTSTEIKYFSCMKKCNLEYPDIDDTQADSLTKFRAKMENEKCNLSCQERYGITLPLLKFPELE